MGQSDRKNAIYVDTSTLLEHYGSGKVSLHNIEIIYKVISSDIYFVHNSILKLEIDNKLDNMNIPAEDIRKNLIDNESRKQVKNIFQSSFDKYKKAIDDLFTRNNNIALFINPSEDDIIEGCLKEYNKLNPWATNKTNEWKDFFVQNSLINFYEKNKNNYNLYVLTKDKAWKDMESHGITIFSGSLSDFMDIISATYKVPNSYYLLFYDRINNEFAAEIINKVKNHPRIKDSNLNDHKINLLKISIKDFIYNNLSQINKITCSAKIAILHCEINCNFNINIEKNIENENSITDIPMYLDNFAIDNKLSFFLSSCSFCDKKQNEVQTLIAGTNVFICNECVSLCSGVIMDKTK
jgi:hypothetical protein